MTKLYLDTEFNGFGGKLMSLALVPDDDAYPEFYCEIEITDQLDPWVRDNVVPHLTLLPVSYSSFQQKLCEYLQDIGTCVIIADWPDDIRYFCEALITGPGDCLYVPNIKFELNFDIWYTSKVPHNALWDARAIKENYERKDTTAC